MNHASTLDFSFRPSSYWECNDPIELILGGIKGDVRRQYVRELLSNGRAGEVPQALLNDHLGEPDREIWGAIHPAYMGGEYLPDALPGEAAIARVSLQSTTGDVIDLCARPMLDGRIGYRIVDEYETRYELPLETTDRPLAVAEVIRQLDECHGMVLSRGPGIVFPPLTMNYGRGPHSHDDVAAWRRTACSFIRVESRFYPGLDTWYTHRIEGWVDALIAARGRQT